MNTLDVKDYNKSLTRILLVFQYNSLSSELHCSLSDIVEMFPADLLPQGVTQYQAIINLFENHGLVFLGSTQLDKAIIRHKNNMGLILESRIV
jgi:hypothetical protein